MNSKMKNVFYFLPVFVIVSLGFLFFAPFVTEAEVDASDLTVSQTVSSGISLSCGDSITLAPEFPSNPTGLTPASGPAYDDFDCTVATNNSGGFGLSIKNKYLGGTDIALVHNTDSSYVFTNYDITPKYTWTDPLSGEALLAFTIGAVASSSAANDIVSGLKNNGSVCGSGSNTNDSSSMGSSKCWRGLNDTTNVVVASSSDETSGGGETFRLRFQARANSIPLKAGYYTTDLTVTATY